MLKTYQIILFIIYQINRASNKKLNHENIVLNYTEYMFV